MGLRIRTNVQSLVSRRHLTNTGNRLQKSMEQLASGERINRAADDAAGLAISENLRADIRSMTQARRNALDGISFVQVAEGGLEEITNIMIRLKELSVQSASDTIGKDERRYLNREFMQLKDEVDRIAVSTEFNGTRLLAGNAELDPELMKSHNSAPWEIQVGKDYITPPDSLDEPNPVNIIRIDFSHVNALTTGEGSLGIGNSQDENSTRIDSKVEAQQSMSKLDEALTKVADFRSEIGSIQNRLETAGRNLSVGIENLSSARSRIRDADFARTTAEMTQSNILQQAGVSVLSQANQLPQVALQLING